jgi:hypothetical protein
LVKFRIESAFTMIVIVGRSRALRVSCHYEF